MAQVGGGAGAGIGGNGGNGGKGERYICEDGKDGENCGIINIYNNIQIYAYGGAGGSSGILSGDNRQQTGSGTGAGGYPAAGIGGGGAGGGGANHVDGAGGYSGGCAEDSPDFTVSNNGLAAHLATGNYSTGGGYLAEGKRGASYVYSSMGGHLGGQGPLENWCEKLGFNNCYIGSGGYAGQGGNIKVSSSSQIFAYNGNECTLKGEDENYYYTPLNIYIQNGNPIDIYIHNGYNATNRFLKLSKLLGVNISDWIVATKELEYKEYCVKSVDRSMNFEKTNYGQGIGSGAGYIEISNGTYTVDPSMN